MEQIDSSPQGCMQEDLVEESHHVNCNGISAMKVLHFYRAETLQSAPDNLLLRTVKLVQA
jgi:hypothetical protein